MWQVLCVYILDGVAQKQYRTNYPPQMGDKVELGVGEVVVVDRMWREHFTEQPILDVIVRRTTPALKRRKAA